jgi:hypothetical protein
VRALDEIYELSPPFGAPFVGKVPTPVCFKASGGLPCRGPAAGALGRRGRLYTCAAARHAAARGRARARVGAWIKDTSRQGRYHSARFRELAVELGITLERDLWIGWSITTPCRT